ncbi:DUF6402 family protein [Methylomonas sp. HW2-6]|uniref:DUF6402 family protein n=1 Tax=Methylomonas sp. HW2-6 TaxID=3376687 RepID=UPI004042137D
MIKANPSPVTKAALSSSLNKRNNFSDYLNAKLNAALKTNASLNLTEQKKIILDKFPEEMLLDKILTIIFLPEIMRAMGYKYASKAFDAWLSGVDRKSGFTESGKNGEVKSDYYMIDIKKVISGFRNDSRKELFNNVISKIESHAYDDAVQEYNVESEFRKSLYIFAEEKIRKMKIKEECKFGNLVEPGINKASDFYIKAYTNEENKYEHAIKMALATQLKESKLIYSEVDALLGSYTFLTYATGKMIKIKENTINFYIDRISYRLRDSFDFLGDQELGYWDLGEFNKKKGTKMVWLNNDDFMQFQTSIMPFYNKLVTRYSNGFSWLICGRYVLVSPWYTIPRPSDFPVFEVKVDL